MSERFYSGRRDGQMTVRDGIAAANKRPLPPRAVLFKHGEKGLTQIGDLRNAVSKLPAIATSTPVPHSMGRERASRAREWLTRILGVIGDGVEAQRVHLI